MRPRRLFQWLTVAIVAATPAQLAAQRVVYRDYSHRDLADLQDRIRDRVDRAMERVDRNLNRNLDRSINRNVERSMLRRDREIERSVSRSASRIARDAARANSRVMARGYFDRARFDDQMDRLRERLNRIRDDRLRDRPLRW